MGRNQRLFANLLIAAVVLSPRAEAQARSKITINDTGVSPENPTSTRDGTVYFGSTAKGTIYRAPAGTLQAEPWILASTAGLTNVLGVLADEKSNTLWVCQNANGGRGGAAVVGHTALRAFDLTSGAPKGTYPLPADAGICNHIAIGPDGSAYTDCAPGATALDAWFTDAQSINAVDGIAMLADGSSYVNGFFPGKLFRIPINADGTAGTIVSIELSAPPSRPDGMRAVGPLKLLQAEGQGRLTELTIAGNRAEVRVLREELLGATGVTLLGNTAFVLVGRSKGVAVPYEARSDEAERTYWNVTPGFLSPINRFGRSNKSVDIRGLSR